MARGKRNSRIPGSTPEQVPSRPEAPPLPPAIEDPGSQGIDESPRLPPPDEDSHRGGPGGNVGGVSRPPAIPRPSYLETR
jgi:hypothetical protein